MKIVRRPYGDDSQIKEQITDPILSQILARRGIHRLEDLDSSLKGLLHYNQLQDIHVAADEIAQAIMRRARIMIAGDYDVDGMTGTALGVRCLRAFGVPKDNIIYYVPSRYGDGYGLSKNAVDCAIQRKVNLIITVDNGIAAFESVDYAMQNGIRVVVTDHHEIQDRLPNALAVVDPKRKDDNFASKNLCGVGVLFYVMTAVRAKLVEYNYFQSIQAAPNMAQFLDLVCIGTIGDVMPLDNNNRRLVKTGLKQIKNSQCCLGLQALMQVLDLGPSKINARSIAFDFCPHLNAATRIRIDANPAIVNLLTDDTVEAKKSATQLSMCNKRRTDYEKVMLSHALVQLETFYGRPTPQVLGSDGEIDSSGSSKSNGGMPYEFFDTTKGKLSYRGGSVPHELYEQRVTELIASDDSALPEDSPLLQRFDGLVLFEPTFLTGLVGLVANRIKERYGKPCVIFGADVGSGQDGMSELFENTQNKQPIRREFVPSYQNTPFQANMNQGYGNNQQWGTNSPYNQMGGSSNGFNPQGAHYGQGYNGQGYGGSSYSNQGYAGQGYGNQNFAGAGAVYQNPQNRFASNNFEAIGQNGSGGYVTPYRQELAEYQANLQHSFLQDTQNLSQAEIMGLPTGAGYETVVIKTTVIEDVFEDIEQEFSSPDCERLIVGSARSVDGLDLMEVFGYIKTKAPDLLVKFGGHSMAAGAGIKACNLGLFRRLFDEACRVCRIKDENSLEPTVLTDGSLPPSHLCLNFAKDLEIFGPWGKDFEEPKFDGVFILEGGQILKERHLKVKLSLDNQLVVVEGIKFKASPKEKQLLQLGRIRVRVVYTLSVNRYFQQERVQLSIEAIEPIENEEGISGYSWTE